MIRAMVIMLVFLVSVAHAQTPTPTPTGCFSEVWSDPDWTLGEIQFELRLMGNKVRGYELYRLIQTDGEAVPGTVRCKIRLTRNDFLELSQATRRELKRWLNRKIYENEGRPTPTP